MMNKFPDIIVNGKKYRHSKDYIPTKSKTIFMIPLTENDIIPPK